MSEKNVEYGPLGPGHTPVKDPLKGLRGVISGTLFLEAITIFLALTVILQVENGSYWTTFNWAFIVVLGTAHVILAFVQRFQWGLPAALVLQVIGVIGGLFIHWSVVAVMVIFILVWWYLLSLRKSLIERMRRGLLVTQHLGASGDDE